MMKGHLLSPRLFWAWTSKLLGRYAAGVWLELNPMLALAEFLQLGQDETNNNAFWHSELGSQRCCATGVEYLKSLVFAGAYFG